MVAFVSGNALGLFNSSLGILGAQGAIGNAGLGRSGEQAYVNVATGNLTLQKQDELLVGMGPDASLVRTYNSAGLLNDDNGDNWRLGIHKRLYGLTGTLNTAGSTIRRTDGDGAELIYTYDAARGLYVNHDGSGSVDTLAYSSGTWTWTDGDTQFKEVYDWAGGSGKLLSLADTDGNALTYSYTGTLLTLVTDASGEKTYLDYNGSNLSGVRTVNSSGATLTRVRYGYDASNRLVSVTVDLTPADNSIADGKVYTTTYSYDGTSKRIAGIAQTDGTQIGFSYMALADGSIRVTQIVQSVEGGDRITDLAYDLANRQTTVIDPLGNSTTYSYDSQGRLIELQGPSIDGGPGQLISYAYDANGNVVNQTDALGHIVNYQYDGNGNLVLQRDAAGNTVTRTYGSRNELLTEIVYITPDPDGAGAAQPGQPQTTRYAYDSKKHLRFAVSPEGRVTEYRYNAQGLRAATIVYAGNTYATDGLAVTASISEATLVAWTAGSGVDKTRSLRTDVAYDFRGQVSHMTKFAKVDTAGLGISDGSQSVTHYVYDQGGQLLKSMAAKGVATTSVATDFVTSYSYDGLGRILATTDTLGNITLNQYDDAANKTTSTLANGLASTSTYNRAGELISVLQADGGTALGETKYVYDSAGRFRMTQNPLGVRRYSLYDEAGRKIADIDGTGSLTEYVYNAANQLATTIRRANPVTSSNRVSLIDANGNPTTVTLSSIRPAASAGDRSSWNLYDAAGRLVKSIDELGYVTETQYDGAARVIASVRYANAVNVAGLTVVTQLTDAAATPTANAAADRRTRTLYDNDGKPSAVLDAEGYLTENQYDAAGRLIHTVAYATQAASAYWAAGTLEQLRPVANAAQDIHNWTLYDGQSRAVAQVDGEGYLTETLYDVNGNQTRQTRYVNNALIAPAAMTSSTQLDSLRPAAHSQDRVTTWTYTDLNQVQTTTDPEGTVTQYTYDDVGNRIKTEVALGTAELRAVQFRYDKQGRLTGELTAEGSAALAALGAPTTAQINTIWAQYGITHTYDKAGQRINSIDQNGNKTRFYYDADGQLYYSINALGEVTRNVYNGLDQLTQVIRYGTRLDSATLATFNGSLINSTVTNTIAALANAALDSNVIFEYDKRGQLIKTTDVLGNANTISYNAFGERSTTTDKIDAGSSVVTVYDVNRRGLVTQVIEDTAGIARITKFVYDAFGRVIQSIDGNSAVSSRQYDRVGRVVQTIDALNISRSTTYDAFDRVLTQKDGNGNTTTIAYNRSNRTTTVTTPEGIQVVTTVNRHGETALVKDGRGNTISHSYDRNGNLTSVKNDALNIVEGKVYDKASRLIESTDGNGVKTVYSYDAANRMLSRTLDSGGLALTTTYSYDAKGQVISVTDPNGVVTQTSYDIKGQVVQVAVDPTGLNLQTTYTYDARGRTLTVTEGAGSGQTRVIQYTYDKLGRRIREVRDPGGLNLTTQYAYDGNDNLVSQTDPNGNVTRHIYDAGNRLAYRLDALNGLVGYAYDAEGRIVMATAYANALQGLGIDPTPADIQEKIVADASQDRISRSVYDKDGREVFTINALWGVTKNIYDANGNVVERIAYAKSIASTTSLTIAGVTAALTVDAVNDSGRRSVYDAANRLAYSIDAAGAVTQNVYDKSGNVVRTVQYANTISVSGQPTLSAVAAALVANPGADRSTRTVYDKAGRAVYVIDAHGYVKETQYDKTGKILKTIEHGQPIEVGDAPTIAQVVAAIKPDIVAATTVNKQTIAATDTPPVQPYAYIAGATLDTASTATQNVTLQAENTSQVQSANVKNYAWYRNGSTLSTGAGISIAPGYVSFGDTTPTEVKAMVYKDGVLYATTYTSVAYSTQETWAIGEYGAYQVATGSEGGYATTHWHGVSNWSGQVNLTTGSLPAGTYTVTLSTRDTVVAKPYLTESGMVPYDGDGTWSYSKTITINVGQITKPTKLSWASSTQPSGTTASFSYRAAGSSAAFTAVAVTTSGSTQQANPGNLAAGNYEYRIQYTDTYGRVVKSAAGTFTSTAGAITNTTAAFSYIQLASTAVAGASIGGYIPAADAPAIDYLEAVVTDRLSGTLISSTKTYPGANANYAGQLNLKTGSALANGSYKVAVVIHYKNGTTATRTPFVYEIGPQTVTHRTTTLSWSPANQPANSTARLFYAPAGLDNYIEATINLVDGKNQTVIAGLTDGAYQYYVRYLDNTTGQVMKEAAGQFTAAASGSTTADLQFQADLTSAPLARINSFSYDKAGRLVESTDAEGFIERYSYDALGNKISFTNKKNAVWTYAYDGVGRLTSEYSPTVAVTTVNDSLAVSAQTVSLETRIAYDAIGNVISRTEAYGRPEARTTQYQYDALGRQIKTIFPQVGIYNAAADNLATNGTNGTVSRTDTQGLPSSTVIYDSFGNAVVSIDAVGNHSYKVYDKLGRIQYEIDAERYVTEYQYDSFGNQVKLIRRANRVGTGTHTDPAAPYTAAEVAGLLGAAATGDRTIQTQYDRLGNAIRVIEPEVYTYDSSAAAGSQYFTAGRTTKNVYNAFGQLIQQSVLQNALTDTWTHTHSYYDRRGNKVAQVDPLGYLTTWTYDAENNLTRQVEYVRALAAGSWNVQSHAAPTATTPGTHPDSAIGYDREIRFTYDGNNRKVKETVVNAEYATTTGNLGVTTAYGDINTEYAYDGVGNLIRMIDGNGIATYTYYDVLGRTRALVTPAGTDQLGLTVMDHDAFGNAARQIRYANGTASAGLDSYTAPVAHGTDQVSYSVYNSHGKVTREVDAEAGSRFYSYDAMGRVAKEWQPITDVDGKVQNAVKIFQYDKLGQHTATIEPSFLPNAGLAQISAPLALEPRSLTFSVSASASYQANEYGYSWVGQNKLNLAWPPMAGWGDGDVTVQVDYSSGIYYVNEETGTHAYGGGARSVSRTYSSAAASSGLLLSWDGDGISAVQRVRVYKKDVNGASVLIHDRSASGAYGTTLSWTPPPQTGMQMALRYRPVAGGAWSTASISSMGSKYVFNSTSVPAGSYYFEVLYTRPGESAPSLHSTGQFTVNGSTGTISNAQTNVSSYTAPTLSTAGFTTSQASYNAFGEIIAKGVNGWQEYYEYDNAGRVWRSNGSGIDTVNLYNLQGQASAEIRSQTLDLRTAYSEAQSVAALSSGVMRTDTVYDLNSRAIKQILPSLTIDRSLEVSTSALTYPQATLSFSVAGSSYVTYDEAGSAWTGNNKVNLGWNAMSSWGSGQVRVEVEYLTAVSTLTDESGTYKIGGEPKSYKSGWFSAAQADTGLALSWSGTAADGGISAVKRVRVYKKDANGKEVLVHDRSSSGAYAKHLLIPTPTEIGGKMELNYKPAGGTGWASPQLYNFGSLIFADLSDTPAGTYDYQVLYYHKNASGTGPESTPYAHATGTFSVNGVSGTLTQSTQPGNGVFSTLTPVIHQSFDRWGNVLSATNPRDALAKTSYRYNYRNQAMRETRPLTEVYGIDGKSTLQSPVSHTYYDKAGRAIASTDANGNTQTARYNTAGQVTTEYRPDGGVITHVYNRLGQKIKTTDPNGYVTTYTYDRLDRLKTVTRPIGTEQYFYDQAGNRIRQINANGQNEYNWYDTRGKLIRTRLPMGQETNLYYDRYGNKTKELNANGDIATWNHDYFGRLQSSKDIGGATTTMSYNKAGLLTSQTSTRGQSLSYGYYDNGALKTIVDNKLGAQTLYEYDAAGNRTRERYVKAGVTHQDNRIRFDSLGRIVSVQDNRYTLSHGYDANGNRRFTKSSYVDTAGAAKNIQNWYLYDSLNRLTLSQGALLNGSIQVTTAQGIQLSYDAAGNRKAAFSYTQGGTPQALNETYSYDANHRLVSIYRNNVLESTRTYDAAGRVIEDVSNASGTNYQRRLNTYNSNGWLTQQETRNSANVAQSRVNYTKFDHAGNVLNYQMAVLTGTKYTNYYRYQYLKQDGYKEQVIYGTSSYFQAGNTTSTYDVNGNLVSVVDKFNANKTRSFVTDQAGHILNKTENGLTQYYFYVNDKANGSTGANGNADFDFNYTPVSDQYPASTPANYVVSQGDTLRSIALAVYGDAQLWYLIADANGLKTDAELTAGKNLKIPNQITNLRNDFSTFKPYSPGEIIGDTMPTLPDPPPPPQKGGGCGVLGQILMIIVAVVATVLTAGALAGAAAQGLGAMWTAGATALGGGALGASTSIAAGLGSFGTGFVAGAVGSVVSQGLGVATGVQDKFSWKSVALSGLSAGVTAGVGSAMGGPAAIEKLKGAELLGKLATRAAVGSVITQGIGGATGLQDKFSWQNVAASAAGATVGGAVRGELGNAFDDFGKFGGQVARGTISGFAAGAAASIVSGGKLNVVQVATDAFGNALGNSIAETNWGGSQQTETLKKVQTNASTGSYWDTHPMVYASNDISDDFMPNTANAADKLKLFVGSGDEDAISARYAAEEAAREAASKDLIAELQKQLDEIQLGREINQANLATLEGNGLGSGLYNLPSADSWLNLPTTNPDLLNASVPDSGFLRGLAGEGRSVMEDPAPVSENMGLVFNGAFNSLGHMIKEPFAIAADYAQIGFQLGRGGLGLKMESVDYSSMTGKAAASGISFGQFASEAFDGVVRAPGRLVVDGLSGNWREFGSDLIDTVGLAGGVAGLRGLRPTGSSVGFKFIGANSGLRAGATGEAGSVVTSGSNGTIFSGHGGYEIGSGITVVPEGTSLTVYSKFGATITNRLGNVVETGGDLSKVYSRTYGAGERLPNYTLYAPDGLTLQGSPVTVSSPTRLSDLLKPGMGDCQWAACTYNWRASNANTVFDTVGIGNKQTKQWITIYSKD